MLLVTAILGLLAASFTVPVRAAEPAGHATILVYHHVSESTPRITSVTPAEFRAQLEYLEKNGFRVWGLDAIAHALRERAPIPDRTVAITFDDAYVSVYTEAWPMLRRRGWPFTIFTNTDGVERGFGALLTWAQLREMARGGAIIANHTHTHTHMIRRRPDESRGDWLVRQELEIRRAESLLEEHVYKPVKLRSRKLFAYPYGEHDRHLRKLVEKLGYTGFGQHSGAAGTWSSLQALPRFPVAGPYSDPAEFGIRVASLPLPVRSANPVDTILPPGDSLAELEIVLDDAAPAPQRLNCFATGQGAIPVTRTAERPPTFRVRAPLPLGPGRTKYNCTAREAVSGRFYWYSVTWMRPNPDGSWYKE